MTGRRGGGRRGSSGLRNQGGGGGVGGGGSEVSLRVLCGTLGSSRRILLLLELFLLQAALLLTKLGPAVLEPDLADRYMFS